MKIQLKEIMFEAGKKYKCLKSITLNGKTYFTAGDEYECKSNNCLINNMGEENFVQQSFLPNFF